MRESGDYVVTRPEGSTLRPDDTSTCPATRGGEGDHHFLPNRERTAFSCSCGARAALAAVEAHDGR